MTNTLRLTTVPLNTTFSRCRCVDAPVVLRYGKVYAAVPCAPTLGGLLKGRITRVWVGGGGAVA